MDDPVVYVPPTAKSEFDDLEEEVRRELHQDISKHKDDFQQEYHDWDGKLGNDQIRDIRDRILDYEMDAAPFLRQWYDQLLEESYEIDPARIEYGLDNFDAEIDEDSCEDIGGWKAQVTIWTQGLDSPSKSVKSQLEMPGGNDREICLESHSISMAVDSSVVLGTADGDFVDQKEDDDIDITRKEHIEAVTAVDEVRDLR